MKTVIEQILEDMPEQEIITFRKKTLADICREIGGNHSNVYQIVRREKRASEQMQKKLSRAFQLPPIDLFDCDGMARISGGEYL